MRPSFWTFFGLKNALIATLTYSAMSCGSRFHYLLLLLEFRYATRMQKGGLILCLISDFCLESFWTKTSDINAHILPLLSTRTFFPSVSACLSDGTMLKFFGYPSSSRWEGWGKIYLKKDKWVACGEWKRFLFGEAISNFDIIDLHCLWTILAMLTI